MEAHDFHIRPATADDIPAMFDIRTSVRENAMTLEQLAAVGITPESIRRSLGSKYFGWVAEDSSGAAMAFSMVDVTDANVLGLFTRPGFEGRGFGTALLHRAVECLFERGLKTIWLTTGRDTPAATFYLRRGWHIVSETDKGEARFELCCT